MVKHLPFCSGYPNVANVLLRRSIMVFWLLSWSKRECPSTWKGNPRWRETSCSGMARHSLHADVPISGQYTPKGVTVLSLGPYNSLNKADNSVQCVECLHPYLATTYNFSPEPSFDKCQDAFHVSRLALSADPVVEWWFCCPTWCIHIPKLTHFFSESRVWIQHPDTNLANQSESSQTLWTAQHFSESIS